MPRIAAKGIGLNVFAHKMLEERLKDDDKPKHDFLNYITKATDENGQPYHRGQSELIAECINLIVGGELGLLHHTSCTHTGRAFQLSKISRF